MSNSFVNEMKTNPYLCIICFKSFPEKLKLSLHTTSVHLNHLNNHVTEVHDRKSLNAKTIELNANVVNQNLDSKIDKSNLSTHIAEVHERKNLDEKTI